MGAIRKPRFLDGDVEKAMDGFFNNLLGCFVVVFDVPTDSVVVSANCAGRGRDAHTVSFAVPD